jgi:spore coat protein CotH
MSGQLLRYPVSLCVMVLTGLVSATATAADDLTADHLFDSNRVIEVSIELPVKSWDALRKQTRDAGKIFSGSMENPFTSFKANITVDGKELGAVSVRKKGFLGSMDDTFPSLKIKLDEYQDQSVIAGLDNLTLNNNKQDTSLLSQYLAYRLFNAAGVQAPRCGFARVTVNGKYLGIYSNVESVGKPFLERRFGNSSGNLYEGTLADFYPKAIDRMEAKTNKKNHDRTKISRLAEILAAKDDLPLEEIRQLVDLETFMRFWAMEGLIGFWDGYSNNQNNYWIYDNVTNGKLYFMPWGADMAFMPSGFPSFGPRGPVAIYAEAMLANRLFHNEQTCADYRETMRWLLANAWNEAELLKTIDEFEVLLKGHLHARQAGAVKGMKSVRSFIKSRRQAVEKELDDWPVRVSPQPRRPMYQVEVGTARGHFATEWTDNAPPNLATRGQVKLQLELEGKTVDMKQSGAGVHRQRSGGFPFSFGPPAAGPSMASITVTGLRDSDEKAITLTLTAEQTVLLDQIGKPFAVQGTLSDPDAGFSPFPRRTVNGNVTLTKAGIKTNDAVEGEFELTIYETHGGFMGRRPGGPAGGPPPGPPPGMGGPGQIPWSKVSLIALREVQDELSVTEAQRVQLDEIQRELKEKSRENDAQFRQAFESPEEQRMELFQAVGRKTEEANRKASSRIDEILDVKQVERLTQLQRQREGAGVLARPDIATELKLTPEQQERIQSLRSTTPFGPPFGQTDEQRRESITELLEILDDAQKDKWASMTGKEFRFPNPPNPNPPGPGPDKAPQ